MTGPAVVNALVLRARAARVATAPIVELTGAAFHDRHSEPRPAALPRTISMLRSLAFSANHGGRLRGTMTQRLADCATALTEPAAQARTRLGLSPFSLGER